MIDKLNLGCGKKKLKGYLNCDISKEVNPDKIVNLEKKLPFESNSFIEVRVDNVLEHVNNFIYLMEEIWRVSKPNAVIIINVPYFRSYHAFADPTHKRFFAFKTFEYFTEFSELNYYSKARFKIISKVAIAKIGRFHNKPRELLAGINTKVYEKLFSRIFPIDEIKIILKVVKVNGKSKSL